MFQREMAQAKGEELIEVEEAVKSLVAQVKEDEEDKNNKMKKDFFKYRIKNSDGVYWEPYRIGEVRAPFEFALVPLEEGLKSYIVKVDDHGELMYFKRVIGRITTNLTKQTNEIKDVFYFIGKNINGIHKGYIVDCSLKKEFYFENKHKEKAYKEYLETRSR